MARASADNNLKFLLSCVKHTNSKIEFSQVAEDCGIVSRGAAAKRYERLQKAFGPDAGKNSSSRNGTPSSSSASRRVKPRDKIAEEAERKRRKIEGDRLYEMPTQHDHFEPTFTSCEPMDYPPYIKHEPQMHPHIIKTEPIMYPQVKAEPEFDPHAGWYSAPMLPPAAYFPSQVQPTIETSPRERAHMHMPIRAPTPVLSPFARSTQHPPPPRYLTSTPFQRPMISEPAQQQQQQHQQVQRQLMGAAAPNSTSMPSQQPVMTSDQPDCIFDNFCVPDYSQNHHQQQGVGLASTSTAPTPAPSPTGWQSSQASTSNSHQLTSVPPPDVPVSTSVTPVVSLESIPAAVQAPPTPQDVGQQTQETSQKSLGAAEASGWNTNSYILIAD